MTKMRYYRPAAYQPRTVSRRSSPDVHRRAPCLSLQTHRRLAEPEVRVTLLHLAIGQLMAKRGHTALDSNGDPTIDDDELIDVGRDTAVDGY